MIRVVCLPAPLMQLLNCDPIFSINLHRSQHRLFQEAIEMRRQRILNLPDGLMSKIIRKWLFESVIHWQVLHKLHNPNLSREVPHIGLRLISPHYFTIGSGEALH